MKYSGEQREPAAVVPRPRRCREHFVTVILDGIEVAKQQCEVAGLRMHQTSSARTGWAHADKADA